MVDHTIETFLRKSHIPEAANDLVEGPVLLQGDAYLAGGVFWVRVGAGVFPSVLQNVPSMRMREGKSDPLLLYWLVCLLLRFHICPCVLGHVENLPEIPACGFQEQCHRVNEFYIFATFGKSCNHPVCIS